MFESRRQIFFSRHYFLPFRVQTDQNLGARAARTAARPHELGQNIKGLSVKDQSGFIGQFAQVERAGPGQLTPFRREIGERAHGSFAQVEKTVED
jgi:hypothetical protein